MALIGQVKTSYLIQIQAMAFEVGVGQNAREVCPCCGGGSSRERSLSIYRFNRIQASYTCWRANCELGSGRVSLLHDGEGLVHSKTGPVTWAADKAPKVIPSAPLDERRAYYIKRHLNLTDAEIAYGGISQTRDGKIIYSIYNDKRKRIGNAIRAYKDIYEGHLPLATMPKTINQMFKEQYPLMSWYYKGRNHKKEFDTLVVVEDIPSALRLNPYTDSLALMGTHFADDKAAVIRKKKYKHIYLCLDQDATRKAARLTRQSQLLLPQIKVKFIKKDIKNMDQTELEEFLKGVTHG